MKSGHNGLARIPAGYLFHEEPPADPKPGAVTPPAPVDPTEPKSIEERIEALKIKDHQLYDVLFGRGVTKGKADVKVPLSADQIVAAEKLFGKVKPDEIEALLKAREDAQTAAVEKARAEKNFTEYSAKLEETWKARMQEQQSACDRQLQVVNDQLKMANDMIDRLRSVVHDSKITREVVDAAKAIGFIDPTDAAVQLLSNLDINDQLDVVRRGTTELVDIGTLVADLAAKKPHLVRSRQRPGTGVTPPTNPQNAGPGGNPEKPVFKRSQLRDPAFYRANEAAIMQATRENRIVDDIGKKP